MEGTEDQSVKPAQPVPEVSSPVKDSKAENSNPEGSVNGNHEVENKSGENGDTALAASASAAEEEAAPTETPSAAVTEKKAEEESAKVEQEQKKEEEPMEVEEEKANEETTKTTGDGETKKSEEQDTEPKVDTDKPKEDTEKPKEDTEKPKEDMEKPEEEKETEKKEKDTFDDLFSSQDKSKENAPGDGEEMKGDEKPTTEEDKEKKEEDTEKKEEDKEKKEGDTEKKEENAEKKEEDLEKKEGNTEKKDSDETKKEEDKEKEVFDVKDDGNDDEEEEEEKSNFPNDEKYFKALPQEELEWYKDLGPTEEEVMKKRMVCTTCQKQILNRNGDYARRHPALGVMICRSCHNFYGDGEWKKDEEGFDEFCRWCGQGGDILLCDNTECKNVFCKKCIRNNLGRNDLSQITSAEEWKCLICDPKQIYKFRAFYHTLSKSMNYMKGIGGRSRSRKSLSEEALAKRKEKQERLADREQNLEKYEAELVHNPENFIDENISSAFKTLELYQKALEDERKRWIRLDKQMTAEHSGNMVRSLRRIYSTTKKNMGLLDAALVQSFTKEFPRANRDKIEIKKPGATTPKKGGSRSSSSNSARKIAPKKRKRSNVIELNGSPVTGRYTPAKRAKTSNSKPKVSNSLFKGKSRPKPKSKRVEEDSDSDIECVEVMKPSIMKKKMGPKSRVH